MPEQHGLSGRLTPSGHELRQRIYFEDTDFSGRVYHARYLHFLERGRSDFLRLLGIGHAELAGSGFAFAVRRLAIDFLKPAAIDDLVVVHTRKAGIGGARINLGQSVWKDDVPLVSAEVTIALLGPGGRVARLPDAIRRALAS
jgi:acyl-CoA thioester hydrolase